MKLLIDTHVFLWLMDEPEKLSRKALEDADLVTADPLFTKYPVKLYW